MLKDIKNEFLYKAIAEWKHTELSCLFHYWRDNRLTFSWVDRDGLCHRKIVKDGDKANLEEIDGLLVKRGFTRNENDSKD